MEPDRERIIRVLENRSAGHAEPIALGRALLTLPLERLLERVNLVIRAGRAANAIGPAHIAEIILAGFFVLEPLGNLL